MPKFKLTCKDETGNDVVLNYDSDTSEITESCGKVMFSNNLNPSGKKTYGWNRDNPATKSKDIRTLKISLGLSCNYSCTYCSQRFVPHADESTKGDVPEFLKKISSWFSGGEDGKGSGVNIEFWGGEPLVYWKTLKPLAEGIRAKYPNAEFLMITNGTLLDDEKIDWIDRIGFAVGISHDGPGYHLRGSDPLDDPEKRKMIMRLYRRLRSNGRISINAMLNKDNRSRAAIQEFLVKNFGENVRIGEGSFIDAYDADAVSQSLTSYTDQIAFRRQAYEEIRDGRVTNFMTVDQKVRGFISTFSDRSEKNSINQKCGIDSPHTLIVDLKGNVITCQNVSVKAVAPNGESHNCGNVDDLDNVRVKTITSWNHRDECKKCPVLHLCRGSCTFLDGDLFQTSCDNAFSDNIVFFVAAIEAATGVMPVYIEGPQREDRKDIFGVFSPIVDAPVKKVIPISVERT